MTSAIEKSFQMTARQTANTGVGDHDTCDDPRLTDYVTPYFFVSSHMNLEITRVSPSVSGVLGYEPDDLVGMRLPELYSNDCVLNADQPTYRHLDATHGQSTHWLRRLRTRRGTSRVVSILTVAVKASGGDSKTGGSAQRLHSVAEDVTASVTHYAQMVARHRDLSRTECLLSGHEIEVATRIRQGEVNREIADALNVSERTIDRRRAAIMRRLHVTSTAEMVAKLVERTTLQNCIEALRESQWYRARNADRAVDAELQ